MGFRLGIIRRWLVEDGGIHDSLKSLLNGC